MAPSQPEPDDVYRCLLAAVRAGEAAEVDHLLTKERPQGDDPRCTTLFKVAVKGGHLSVVRCLLRHRIVPLCESPVFVAMEEINALEVVLAAGYSVHVMSSTCKTPLQMAISLNPSALPVLLRAGCDVTARDPVQGNTPLHTACARHEESALLPLIQTGAWLNVPNGRGETPLHCLLRHACPSYPDFHVRSRHNLARCLIHVGCHVTTSPGGRGRVPGGHGGRPQYKVAQLYQRLLRESRRCVGPLQHLCRLTIRSACEEAALTRRRRRRRTLEKEDRSGGDFDLGRGSSNMLEAIESLDLSCFLKDYLLYKQHVFDKEALSACKVRLAWLEDST